MSDERYFINEYKKYKQQIEELERKGEGESKNCTKLRQMLINVWNKMTPPQQREIAVTYIPD